MSLWEDTIQGGASWSLILRRGNLLRLEDTEGGANVAALFYNWESLVERYNMPDTLKGPAHRAPHPGVRFVFRYGPRHLFHHIGFLRLA